MLIGLAVALAFVLNYLALQNRDASVLVAVADRPIPEGSILTEELIRMVAMPADFEAVGSLIDDSELESRVGRITTRSIDEGGLIDEASVVVVGVADGLRTMSIPVPSEHAAGARIVVGDRVDVITVSDGVADFVATDLLVVDHADPDGDSFGTESFHVTVAVGPGEALSIAEAISVGSLEVIRSTGASPIGSDGD